MRHWELDDSGQPTQKIVEARRRAEFITPIPKPKKRKRATTQEGFVFDEGKGLSTKEQQYDPTSIINEVRSYVDRGRGRALVGRNNTGKTNDISTFQTGHATLRSFPLSRHGAEYCHSQLRCDGST